MNVLPIEIFHQISLLCKSKTDLNVTTFVDTAMFVLERKVFLGLPVLADIPTQIYYSLRDSAVPALRQCALPLFLYRVVHHATIARMPNHR